MAEMIRAEIEHYATEHTTTPPEELAEVASATYEQTPIPEMMTGRVEAKLLEALVVATEARRVLEVGTFTGHGALAMASRVAEGGSVVTIERDEQLAAIARRNIARSPHASRIELLEGDARDLVSSLDGPFDLVFLDAWKIDYVHYYEATLPKLAPRGLLVADNVLWHGLVVDPNARDAETAALRAFNDHVNRDPRVDNALLTIGDGLLLAWHRA